MTNAETIIIANKGISMFGAEGGKWDRITMSSAKSKSSSYIGWKGSMGTLSIANTKPKLFAHSFRKLCAIPLCQQFSNGL